MTYLDVPTRCNATQKQLIQGFRQQFIEAVAVAVDPATPHGIFVDSCPNQHCQTSTAWNQVMVNSTTMATAAASWYHLRNIVIRTGTLNWLRFTYDFEIGAAE